MRLYLIIDETYFYIPVFVSQFLARTKDTVTGAALVTKVLPKNSLDAYLKRHWHYLRLCETARLVAGRYLAALKDAVLPKKEGGEFYSVRSVFKFHNVDYIEVEDTLDKPQYLDRIREAEPDVIISSNSIIFGSNVLRIPKICCLNRHCALLPAYQGLFPVLQAYRRAEKYTGVSVHIMEEKIDSGVVLAQKEIAMRQDDTIAGLYKICYSESAGVLLEALEKVRKGDFTPCADAAKREPSYFSFPTKEHWRQFRQRGGRFI